ncbi:hypothetical protein [Sulfobacillus thermotolerans]|uniref:hypothetical protein n=1 Tax=Sulfobacillus thermotolerans TaxID=338644 RepID=UPI0033693EDA
MFTQSAFLPIAIGFFGLGTNYFVWGGQALFNHPPNGPEIDKAVAIWGIWMGGFMQFSAEGWMAIAYAALSLLGTLIFLDAGDVPVGILFIILLLIYLSEIPTRLAGWNPGARLVGLWQFLGAIWLMYLTYGVVFNTSLGGHWWV